MVCKRVDYTSFVGGEVRKGEPLFGAIAAGATHAPNRVPEKSYLRITTLRVAAEVTSR